MALPSQFVWTRYGTEAGERVEEIGDRQEIGRGEAAGTFLWGIGNSVSRGIGVLLARLYGDAPLVVFSPMLSSPRSVDVDPPLLAHWCAAMRTDGSIWELPPGAVVTSRIANLEKPRRRYALVCFSDEALVANMDGEKLTIGSLRNLESGAPVGASQVSAVVSRAGNDEDGPYIATLKAKLIPPYVVELRDPHCREPIQERQRRATQLGLL